MQQALLYASVTDLGLIVKLIEMEMIKFRRRGKTATTDRYRVPLDLTRSFLASSEFPYTGHRKMQERLCWLAGR